MLNNILSFSIRNKLIIALFTVFLIIVGIYALNQLPIDAVPDITNNQVVILTASPSLAAQEVENLITFPIESAMTSIPNIEEIRSFSRFGLSVVTLVFKDNADIYWARQQVGERLIQAKNQIPAGAGEPELAPVTTGLGEIYQYSLHPKPGYEKKYDPMKLRTIQDWIVRRQLLGTEGVAEVSSFGGFLKQYEIALNPEKLSNMNVSIQEVFSALEKNNQNTGGAYIEKKPNTYFIRTEGLIHDTTDIQLIVVRNQSNGTPLLIRDIAEVHLGHATRYGAMVRNLEGEVVGAVVMMLKGANSAKVIEHVKEKIAEIEKNLPEGLTIEPFLDRTKLVNRAISTVTKNLAEGALIVIFVLTLFLGNLRAGLVVASVIPLAMLFAVICMNLFGVSGNLMSLGAIDFGLIVDGAVIIVEATLHHLMHRKSINQLTQSEMDNEVYQSASKMRSAAAFGVMIILIVYLPILVLVGIEGKMFKPMAMTVSFAIIGAFILSLTYVPMISSLLLSKKANTGKTISDKMMDIFQAIYGFMIRFVLKRKKAILLASFLLFLGSIWLFSTLGGEFLPSIDEGDFAVETRIRTGSSLSETVLASQKGAKILLTQFPDEVEQVVGKIGSSEVPTDPMPLEACDLMVILKDKEGWKKAENKDELAEKMTLALDAIPDVAFSFQQPIQMRFNELMTGARQDVVLKIYGEELTVLATQAQKLQKLIEPIEGITDIYVEKVTGLPQISIEYDREKIAQFGLTIQDINQTVRTAFAGEVAGVVYEGEKRFDLVVRLDTAQRKGIEDIKGLYVEAPNGQQIPLEQLATVDFKMGPNQIQRDDAKRRIIVAFNVRGRDVQTIVAEIKAKIAKSLAFPPGYYVKYGGSFENLVAAKDRLSIAVPAALLLIFVLLFFTFGSLTQSALIFTAIPLSAMGGIFSLWARDMPFSISAGVGFIALFGVAVLNGIVLISEFNYLKENGMTNLHKIVLIGTRNRLRPVLMTAMVASMGFLPMALSHGSGAEVQKPLATVVIGGLLSATFLTLFVLPCLYMLFEKGEKKQNKKQVVSKEAIVGLCLIFGCWGFNVQAQTPELSLEDAIQTVLHNNPQLTVRQLETQVQQTLVGATKEIPKTNASLLLGQYNSVKFDHSLSISQTMPHPKVGKMQQQYAETNVKLSEKQKKITENELIFQVKSLYNEWLFLQSERILLQKQDSLLNRFLNIADVKQKVGESGGLEKITAQSQVAENQNLLNINASNIKELKIQLQTLLNQTIPNATKEKALTKKEMIFANDTTALRNNPILAYFRQEIARSKAQTAVERSKLLPDFTAGYTLQSLTGYQNVRGQEKYFGSLYPFQTLQVGLAIPIFQKATKAKIEAANLGEKLSESQLLAENQRLVGEYQQIFQQYEKHTKNLAFYTENALPTANLLSQKAEKSYQAGEIPYFEYLQVLQHAATLHNAHLQALKTYNSTIIYLEFLIGDL